MLLRGVLEMGVDLGEYKYSASKGDILPMIATVSLWFGVLPAGVVSVGDAGWKRFGTTRCEVPDATWSSNHSTRTPRCGTDQLR